MKIGLEDLKKAIAWVEANTNDLFVNIQLIDTKMSLKCTDKYDASVEIVLTEESRLMPKIRKEDRL